MGSRQLAWAELEGDRKKRRGGTVKVLNNHVLPRPNDGESKWEAVGGEEEPPQ